jgi:hypothetical protein
MKRNIRLALVLAGLLSFISVVSAVKTGAKTGKEQKKEEVCNKGITSFVLFRVVS